MAMLICLSYRTVGSWELVEVRNRQQKSGQERKEGKKADLKGGRLEMCFRKWDACV